MKTSELLTLLISLIISLLILELGLRAFTPYPINQISNKIKHEELGYVLNSNMEEIDEHGFRNGALSSPKIITLGDSHTYGENVASTNSWPKQLASKLKSSVYNFGMSGYGVLQYQYLLHKSIELHPEVILLGLYLSNDLNDICKWLSRSQYWKSRVEDFNFDRRVCPEKVGRSDQKVTVHKTKATILWSWLAENLATISIASKYYSDYSALKTIETGEIDNAIVIKDGKIKTILGLERIKAHATYTDLSRPHIQAANEVLKKTLLAAKNESELNNIRFGVLLIPSKERVYYNYLIEKNFELPEVYKELVTNEDVLKDNVTTFLKKMGIPFIDILPDMENALLEHGDIYPANENGHPIKAGYKVYAEGAFDLYQQISK